MSQFTKLLSSVFVMTLVIGCGSSTSGGGGGASVLSTDLIGDWQVTYVTCNGVNITSTYIPVGQTLIYRFDATQVYQIDSSNSCTQTTALPYTLSGATVTVPGNALYSVTCSPASCSDTGMMPATDCGTLGINSTTSTISITTMMGNLMTTREYDSKAIAICNGLGHSTPLTFSLTKQ